MENSPIIAIDPLGLIKECAPFGQSWEVWEADGPATFLYAKPARGLNFRGLFKPKNPVPLDWYINVYRQDYNVKTMSLMRCRDTCQPGWWTELQEINRRKDYKLTSDFLWFRPALPGLSGEQPVA